LRHHAVRRAFVRLTTEAGLVPRPFTVDETTDRVDAWLVAPPAVVIEPGPIRA
jgi:hypothetical protein